MEVTVTGRKMSVPDRFRRHLEEKLEKVPQLAPEVRRTDVIMARETNPRLAKTAQRIEVTCYERRNVIRAEAQADDEYGALDLAMAKLTERLRRLTDRRKVSHRGKRRPPSVAEATADLPVAPIGSLVEEHQKAQATPEPTEDDRVNSDLGTSGNSPIEVRRKVHDSHPMTMGEAINHMELIGHDFFLYFDSDTKEPSVVYRRRGWTYGVIHLEVGAGEAEETAS